MNLLRHIGIAVDKGSMLESVEFYQKLGFDKITNIALEDDENLSYASGFGAKTVVVRTVKLVNQTGDCIELLEYESPAPVNSATGLNFVAVPHLAFTVPDVFSVVKMLAARWPSGYISQPREFGKVYMTFFRDPSGVMIELVEVKPVDVEDYV